MEYTPIPLPDFWFGITAPDASGAEPRPLGYSEGVRLATPDLGWLGVRAHLELESRHCRFSAPIVGPSFEPRWRGGIRDVVVVPRSQPTAPSRAVTAMPADWAPQAVELFWVQDMDGRHVLIDAETRSLVRVRPLRVLYDPDTGAPEKAPGAVAPGYFPGEPLAPKWVPLLVQAESRKSRLWSGLFPPSEEALVPHDVLQEVVYAQGDLYVSAAPASLEFVAETPLDIEGMSPRVAGSLRPGNPFEVAASGEYEADEDLLPALAGKFAV